MKTKRKDYFEPYRQDEKDWLCTIEFLPIDDPKARLYGADIIGYLIGYLVGYANLTNTRSLALLGDPHAGAYELLFSRKASKIVFSNQTQLTDKSYMGSPVALLPGP